LLPKRALLPLLAAAALALAGCADSVAGNPTPAADVSTSTTEPPSTVSTAIDPCALFTATDIQQLGLVSRGPDTVGGARGCSWNKHGVYAVGFSIYDHVGMAQFVGGEPTVTNHPVGSHDGREFIPELGGCGIVLEITRSSSLVLVVSADTDETSCHIAGDFAMLVEPRLPAEQR
jgi:hypothetical protein